MGSRSVRVSVTVIGMCLLPGDSGCWDQLAPDGLLALLVGTGCPGHPQARHVGLLGGAVCLAAVAVRAGGNDVAVVVSSAATLGKYVVHCPGTGLAAVRAPVVVASEHRCEARAG